MTELLSQDEYRKLLRPKRGSKNAHIDPPADIGVFHATVGEGKAVDETRRAYRFCFSDSGEDRMKDTIAAKGWKLNNFLKAPTALFAHDSSSPPIGRAANVMIEDGRLMGDIEFAPPETYAFADTIYRLVQGKFLNAVSVGFLPLEYEWSDDDDREWAIDYKSQELLEISVVPVPANPRALIEARAKGIDTRPLTEWAEKTLDQGGKIMVPRAELDRLRKAAKEPTNMASTPRTPRRKADDDAISDTSTVGNCGRPIGDECGMKDVAECSIHGQQGAGVDDGLDEKKLAALIKREIAAALKAALQPEAKSGRRRTKADDDKPDGDDDKPGDDDRPNLPPDHEKAIRMCSMHMKAMADCLDTADEHHEKAMDALDTVVSALDASPPPGGSSDDDPEAKAGDLARLKALRLKYGS